MSEVSVFRIRNAVRSTHHFYDYNGDGQFDKDRIKGADKKYERRWKRKFANREFIEQLQAVS